jgi:hypothetical protein
MRKFHLVAAVGLGLAASAAQARILQVNNHRNHDIYATYAKYHGWVDMTGSWQEQWQVFGWFRVPAHGKYHWDIGENTAAYLRVEDNRRQVTGAGSNMCIHPGEAFESTYQNVGGWKLNGIKVGGVWKYNCGDLGTRVAAFERMDFGNNTGFEYNVVP